MTREEFIAKMQDVLQTEEALSFDTVLADLDEWDSLSIMATMAFANKHFGVNLKMADFAEVETLEDIAQKVGL